MESIDTSVILPFAEPGFLGEDFNEDIVGVSHEISQQRLYSAYMQGIFPWFNEDAGNPVLWFSPSPRFCLLIEDLHVPKSVRRFLKSTPFSYTMDRDFAAVMHGCRTMERPGQRGSWIGRKMIAAYTEFHANGFAHSVEVWRGGALVGGLYGVVIGSVFCGESMFTVESNSAKSAFVLFALAFRACGGRLIDSQVYTKNIARYGARNISRDAFQYLERQFLPVPLAGDLSATFARLAADPAAACQLIG